MSVELTEREIARRAKQQREAAILKERYPDYCVRYHDVFLSRYQQEREAGALHAFMIARGIIKE